MSRELIPTLNDLVRQAQRRLEGAGSTSARLDAGVLLRHVMGIDQVQLFTRLNETAPEGVAEAFAELVERRLAGTPVAYLTGAREFMGLALAVDPHVLIPRPETELLVEWALVWLGGRDQVIVIDVGTGSGAIAVSIAALNRARNTTIIASDVSEPALDTAKTNADRLLPPIRRPSVQFQLGFLLTWRREPADLILANLPYLTPTQIGENPDLRAEPVIALAGGDDGLDLVRALIADLPRVVGPDGAVGLELDPEQVTTVRDLLREAFPDARIDVIRDLAGHARHLVMTQP